MPIPCSIPTGDGRKPMTPAYLRECLAHLPPFGTPGELCNGLNIVDHGWQLLLAQGFPWPITHEEVAVWFEQRGWTTD
jgi:hypothetical protein